ncbi:hypothetical protein AVEN_200005-1 [Araneus ventricosus]|uniref:Uncharacterized protein n=1 Tax=Araneus ventricosus TaxID=182803 RepID=A0A4Y2BV25_ARAVE|nr:hypothetical protein AVEN_200005-1 [Araneus ventricosus]
MNKESSATVNRLFEAYEDEVMSPQTSMGEVNVFPMPILHDTGSSIDIVCLKVIKPEMFTYDQGTGTAAIVEKMKKIHVPSQVNSIQTRAQKRLEEQEEVVYVKDKDPISVEEAEMAATEDIEIENDDLFSFPPKEEFES